MKYESNILERLIKTYGVVGNPKYVSEIIKQFIIQGKESFPNLFTYQADWLAHIDEFGLTPEYTVSYTGHHIYAPNTKEKPVKSAILSGCTLVNYVPNYTFTRSRNANSNDYKPVIDFNFTLTKGKKYFVRANITKNTFTDGHAELYFDSQTTNQHGIIVYSQKTGIFSSVVTVNIDGVYRLSNMITNHTTDGEVEITDFVILEYQEGMENWDIPYFEGIQSVKMPVLKTVGKNFVKNENSFIGRGDVTVEKNANEYTITTKDTMQGDWGLVEVEPSLKKLRAGTRVFAYGEGSFERITFTERNNMTNAFICTETVVKGEHGKSYTIKNDNVNLQIVFTNSNQKNHSFTVSNIMIGYGETPKTYEPYKSNILTANEDVTLRSNGSVCDELDLLTGKLTQRIDEDGEVLTKEVVKTVDLTILDQNGQNVKQLMSFNGGTHFNTGSLEGSLLPTLTVDVVTDLEEILMVCSSEGITM